MVPTTPTPEPLLPSARWASAIRVRVPPSPLLSARSRISTYLIVTMRMSAHRISESTPNTEPRVTRPAAPPPRRSRLAQRIERARADVAVDDPDAADGQRPEAGVGMRFTVSVDRNVAPAGSSYALGHWQCQKGRYVMLRCNIKRGRRL